MATVDRHIDEKDGSSGDKQRESRKVDEKKYKTRSPSQSPVTIQKSEIFLPSVEEREKWKTGSAKWIQDIEAGYFAKIERQFEASVNGCGLENGIELDTSCCEPDEGQSDNHTRNQQTSADAAAVAAEFWQEVSAKASITNSRSNSQHQQQTLSSSQPEHPASAVRTSSLSDRSPSNSPASSLRSSDPIQPQILRNPQFSQAVRNDTGGGNLGISSDIPRSPGILTYKPPQVRQMNNQPPNRSSGGAVQTGYMRNNNNNRVPENMGRYEPHNDNYRDGMRNRGGGDRVRFQPINLGPYGDLFQETFPGNLKFIDSHAHWCFTIKKLQSQGIETYRDLKNSFPEMFPASFGGSVQVFCLPLYLKSYDHWHRKLIEGTEGEVWFTYGCHPNFVDDWNDDVRAGMLYSMSRAREQNRLVGLGEIGLDYNRQNNNEDKKERQREVFKAQLQLAVQQELPIVIHCRNDESHGGGTQAETECFQIMKQHVPHNWPIHRHCFRGSFEEANKWIEYYPKVNFGFTPCISGTKDNMARDTVRHLPLDRILIETDAPYYTPAQMSNFPMESTGDKQPRKVAIPGGISLVSALEISRLKGVPLEKVIAETRDNTLRLYNIRDNIL